MPSIEEALKAHRESAERFLAGARSVAKDKWSQPIAPGKWSPARIVDHVAISTEVGLKAIKGEKAMPNFPKFLRWLPRKMGFEAILKKGIFPEKSTAPAVFKPSDETPTLDAATSRLEDAVSALESHVRRMAKAGTDQFDHSVFGRVTVADYLRFMTLHLEHHERQLH